MNEIDILEGSGEFWIKDDDSNSNKTIAIHYHKPKNYTADSRILLVLPGAGRNGDSYRDAWIPASEAYGVLVLSLAYSEDEYDFGDYHMGGLMHDLNLKDSLDRSGNSNVATLDENKFSFKVNNSPTEWLFGDFDRVFDLAVRALDSHQEGYDMFGHSAGGQILHRFAIFQPTSKAERVVAANSGFYTLPVFDVRLPFGLKDTSMKPNDLRLSFQRRLVLLVGELDNENETAGTILRSTTVDVQGTHRLARGRFFFKQSKARAQDLGFDFNWQLKVVPSIGHNHRKMSQAASRYLYGSSSRLGQ